MTSHPPTRGSVAVGIQWNGVTDAHLVVLAK